MGMKRRILSLVVLSSLVLGLTACGGAKIEKPKYFNESNFGKDAGITNLMAARMNSKDG